ncbi:MAG: hypothetical protein GY811_12535 [Myxococcales bacterium]|nr:hypothetical protein [Myxococcales bacterium]
MIRNRRKGTWAKGGLVLLAACGLALGGAACGDDAPSSSESNKPKKKARKKSKAKKKKIGKGGFSYPKIDPEIRRKLSEIDFVVDPSGEKNRDPFRSWILKPTIDNGEGPIMIVDVCTEGRVRWGAESYSVRDLALVGLVKRGRSYAQFTDRSEIDSWIVRKGDCIGQEKAIIEEIGVGYVRLSITPPAPPGAPAPPAQKQDISLHPNEIAIPDSVVNNFEDGKPAP